MSKLQQCNLEDKLELAKEFYQVFKQEVINIDSLLQDIKQKGLDFNFLHKLNCKFKALNNELYSYVTDSLGFYIGGIEDHLDKHALYKLVTNTLLNVQVLSTEDSGLYNVLYNTRTESPVKYPLTEIDIIKYIKTVFVLFIEFEIDACSVSIFENQEHICDLYKIILKKKLVLADNYQNLSMLADLVVLDEQKYKNNAMEKLNILIKEQIKQLEDSIGFLEQDISGLKKDNDLYKKSRDFFRKTLEQSDYLNEELYQYFIN